MKQMKKIIAGILAYVLILATLPSGAISGIAEAATTLKKVKYNTQYYVTGASQYKNKTFILGASANEWEKGDSLIVKNGNLATTLISNKEIGNSFGYDTLYKDTPNKIYITPSYIGGSNSSKYGFVVDKNTNKIEKKTLQQIYNPFFTFVTKKGYTVTYITSVQTQNDTINWVVMGLAKPGDDNSSKFAIVNKNGVGKIIEENVSGIVSGTDTSGNLYVLYYYYDQNNESHKLLKITPSGAETELSLPASITGTIDLSDFSVDNNNYLYIGTYGDGLKVFKVNGTSLQFVKSINIDDTSLQDNNKRVWYMQQQGTNKVYGYLDKTLTFIPMFILDSANSLFGFSRVNTISAYGKNIFLSYYKAYALLLSSPPQVPKVYTVDDNDKVLKGTGEPGSTIVVKAGNKTYTTTVKADGTYAITIPIQRKSSVLYITATNAGGSSTTVKVIVIDKTAPASPKVNKVTIRSTKVTGKAEAGATIKVKSGSKTYKAVAKSNGTFSVKINKQRSGNALYVTVTDKAGNVSKTTKIMVKTK